MADKQMTLREWARSAGVTPIIPKQFNSRVMSMKTAYNKPDEKLTIDAVCAACNEAIAIGHGVLRFFGDEEQIATQMGRSGRYPVHADECPANLKRETVTMVGEHVVVTKRSKNPKFPIMATVDGKSTGRVYKNAFVALTKIRQELA